MSNGYRNGAFALGLVVGGGIALNLFLWLDYRARRNIESKTSTGQDTQYSEVGRYWDGLLGTFVSPSDTLAQWVMAFFTIAATGVLLLTLKSANKTNQAAIRAAEAAASANEIMRQEQRPWVLPSDFKFSLEQASLAGAKPERALFLRVFYRNFGASPAFVRGAYADRAYLPQNSTPALDNFEFRPATLILPTGQDRNVTIGPLFGEKIDQILQGELAIYLRVRLEYKVSDSGLLAETEFAYQVVAGLVLDKNKKMIGISATPVHYGNFDKAT